MAPSSPETRHKKKTTPPETPTTNSGRGGRRARRAGDSPGPSPPSPFSRPPRCDAVRAITPITPTEAPAWGADTGEGLREISEILPRDGQTSARHARGRDREPSKHAEGSTFHQLHAPAFPDGAWGYAARDGTPRRASPWRAYRSRDLVRYGYSSILGALAGNREGTAPLGWWGPRVYGTRGQWRSWMSRKGPPPPARVAGRGRSLPRSLVHSLVSVLRSIPSPQLRDPAGQGTHDYDRCPPPYPEAWGGPRVLQDHREGSTPIRDILDGIAPDGMDLDPMVVRDDVRRMARHVGCRPPSLDGNPGRDRVDGVGGDGIEGSGTSLQPCCDAKTAPALPRGQTREVARSTRDRSETGRGWIRGKTQSVPVTVRGGGLGRTSDHCRVRDPRTRTGLVTDGR